MLTPRPKALCRRLTSSIMAMATLRSSTGSESVESASHYEQLSDYQKKTGQTLVKFSRVKRGEKVLDLGCGTGHLAAVLSEVVGPEGRVVAVDPDGERVKIAREKYSRPNIEFLVADDQTFPGDSYNLIFGHFVVQWIMNKDALFERVSDKLRSGGRFVFSTFNGTPEFPSDIRDALTTFAGSDFYHRQQYELQAYERASTYQQLAESAGLVVTAVDNRESTTHWRDLEQLIVYFHGASLGLFDLSAVSKEALKEYEEKNNLGSFHLTRDLLSMIVTKP